MWLARAMLGVGPALALALRVAAQALGDRDRPVEKPDNVTVETARNEFAEFRAPVPAGIPG
jgi:hypothetical protein